MKFRNWIVLLVAPVLIFSCGKKESNDHIEVQHILIAFEGTIQKPTITRTKEEAQKLTYEILEKAKQGDNFDELVEQYTDDSAPGKYKMANTGIEPNKTLGEFSRDGMVKAFGDVGFSLKVGEIGIADYDPQTSKYGWHIIKRIK